MNSGLSTSRRLWFWWLVMLLIVGGIFFFLSRFEPLELNIQKSQPGLYEVTEFVDGDTIEVNMNGAHEIIRMIGIDTPETHHPDLPVQCFGLKAAAYTKSLIGDSRVRLEADPINTNRDRYNRLLRYVYLPDGRLVAEEIIKNGYGFAYTQFPFEKAELFKSLEQQAKQMQKGLWAGCDVESEDNGRKQTNPATLR